VASPRCRYSILVVVSRFIDRRVGRVGFFRKPGRLSGEKLCGMPTGRGRNDDNANSAEKLLRAYRLITELDEISTKL